MIVRMKDKSIANVAGPAALLGALSSKPDKTLLIERGKLHTAELSFERSHHSSF
jgi:hypothetical protein